MNLKDFLKTWEGTQAENKWNRMFVGGLLVAVLALSFKLFTKETIVTIQPATLNDDAWVTKNNASQTYKEAWGVFLAQLTGNVTPGTVSFLKDRLGPLLSPAIYGDVIEALEVQAKQIQNDRVSMRFEPRFVEYEEKSGKVFVTGHSFVKGASGEETRAERTYEYIIAISNYLPVVEFIDTYAGRPRTEKVLEQMRRKEESRRHREQG